MSVRTVLENRLKAAGVRVVGMDKADGKCTGPCVVVQDAGDEKAGSTGARRKITVYCMAPYQRMNEIEPLAQKAKEAMRGMDMTITGVTETVADDALEAARASVTGYRLVSTI